MMTMEKIMSGLKDISDEKIGYICACIAISVIIMSVGSCCKHLNDDRKDIKLKQMETGYSSSCSHEDHVH
jgi:hypothetical protein